MSRRPRRCTAGHKAMFSSGDKEKKKTRKPMYDASSNTKRPKSAALHYGILCCPNVASAHDDPDELLSKFVPYGNQ